MITVIPKGKQRFLHPLSIPRRETIVGEDHSKRRDVVNNLALLNFIEDLLIGLHEYLPCLSLIHILLVVVCISYLYLATHEKCMFVVIIRCDVLNIIHL
jgi:hypothetical protein